MSKFEKVKNALEEKTKNTNDFITVTKNLDARHSGKYAIKNVVTNSVKGISYNTLDEIIQEFDLNI